jgi:GxxExxY protein
MYEDFKYTEVTRKIIGCAMEVHKFLGNGFQESVYQKAMAIEMQIQGLPFNREFAMPVYYKGRLISTRRVDFLVEKNISTELKAVREMDDGHLNQALNYLEAYNLEIGLLINFGSKSLQFKRLINPKFKISK